MHQIADLDAARYDAAQCPECQICFNPRLHDAGETQNSGQLRFRRDDVDRSWRGRFRGWALVAARKKQQHQNGLKQDQDRYHLNEPA
ncbi:hypothetical protein [Mesorhizobium onobrychidis]|uniref:hypothetical protein n=1 Tax=Mesorhizobium onobrychidis TaxID=2775404 RepID=UPI002157F74E|nr:hypothetical protein [Mesorhizobium onobrychidis]